MVGFAELLSCLQIILALFFSHVTDAVVALAHNLIWVLKWLILVFWMNSEALASRRVTGLLSAVGTWESQVLSQLEVHVW